jgi:hypothetical protein
MSMVGSRRSSLGGATMIEAGGVLTLDTRADRKNYSALVSSANRFGKVPTGTRLTQRPGRA